MRGVLALLALTLATPLATPLWAEGLGPRVSGDARMGLAWSSNQQPAWAGQRESGLRMTNRARLHFEFTGQTDGGVRFGAEVTLDTDRQKPRLRSLSIGE